MIDKEVQRLVTEQYDRAQELLKKHQAALKTLAGRLLEQETVDGSVVRKALADGAATSPPANGTQLEPVAAADRRSVA